MDVLLQWKSIDPLLTHRSVSSVSDSWSISRDPYFKVSMDDIVTIVIHYTSMDTPCPYVIHGSRTHRDPLVRVSVDDIDTVLVHMSSMDPRPPCQSIRG